MSPTPDNLLNLSGKTRVYPIIGDPVAQVKSPAGVTQRLNELGRDAVVVPNHVKPEALEAYMNAMLTVGNCDGIIVTIPHKFTSYRLCHTASERAHFLGAVNIIRRNAEGGWHGDMFDGMGMIGAAQAKGATLSGKRVLLVGAGGAGSAIAQAALVEGAASLAVHDGDTKRRDDLIARLNQAYGGRAEIGSADPSGFDCVFNATPMGMRSEDPYPVLVERLASSTFCGCAITAPAVAPWIEAARARGCPSSVGGDMFAAQRELMVQFLLHRDG